MGAITIKNAIFFQIMFMVFAFALVFAAQSNTIHENSNSRRVIQVNNDPDSVIWVVQFSDLHFSVNNHDRALDFINLVGPTLSFVNPSLVLITGDLTDAKSKDLLTTKQDELEWVEYQNVMEHVVKMSGLDKSIFYDMRGNHDNYGVPSVGGAYDFFSNYSINAQLGRSGNVNSVTLQTGKRKHLFVGIDSTMAVGLRGPTNLLGHPTDKLLAELDSELSQWDGEPTRPVTKISFGHFPISFSAASESGKNLKDIFLKHSISAYLCGHLHMSFGKNLKRHHQPGNDFMQLNMHRTPFVSSSNGSSKVQEFWEWEMGDWRSRRVMRILAIDRGHTSFVDVDLRSDIKNIIILPTFPLDSRLMWRSSLLTEYKRQTVDPSDYMTIRALVFSSSPIISVVAHVYDSQFGTLSSVLEASMTKIESGSGTSRGALYAVPWNFKSFEDPNPERYWLQIVATDITGRSTLTDLRPFSINGVRGFLSWTWLEFKVMGCQWEALYLPILWFCLGSFLSILLIPVAITSFSSKQYTMQNFLVNKSFINGAGWILTELYNLRYVWYGILGYLFYLVLCPWLSGVLFTDGGERGYMTYKGWVLTHSDKSRKLEYVAFPDVMVIVIPHLVFVVLPFLLVVTGLAMECERHRIHLLALSGKKEDDHNDAPGLNTSSDQNDTTPKSYIGRRWIRKFLLLVCLGIFYIHFKNCRGLVKAYEMNPFLHFPVYCLWIPLLLAYAIYRTHKV
ncbi:putative metallophosphoesterase At3g03305 [Silene latifolia]|uniref:putative metallophosphoesterase At3g03305 n=1 Tax=Silene latifolia TaxID=37657 RepID=UPI003D7868BA